MDITDIPDTGILILISYLDMYNKIHRLQFKRDGVGLCDLHRETWGDVADSKCCTWPWVLVGILRSVCHTLQALPVGIKVLVIVCTEYELTNMS